MLVRAAARATSIETNLKADDFFAMESSFQHRHQAVKIRDSQTFGLGDERTAGGGRGRDWMAGRRQDKVCCKVVLSVRPQATSKRLPVLGMAQDGGDCTADVGLPKKSSTTGWYRH